MSSKRSYTYVCFNCHLRLNNRDDPQAEHQKHCAMEIATRTIKQARERYGHSVFDDAFLAVLREVCKKKRRKSIISHRTNHRLS